MMHRQNRLIRVTALGALSACTSATPLTIEHNASTGNEVAAEVSEQAAQDAQAASPRTLNAEDAEGRTIFIDGDGDCYVMLPFPADQRRHPGMRGPTQNLACPAEMASPEWGECANGVIKLDVSAEECICYIGGNPPPPPRQVTCPEG
jgi:hypothetical protein